MHITALRTRWRVGIPVALLSLVGTGLLGGCGTSVDPVQATFRAEAVLADLPGCDRAPAADEASTLIVLRWDGGTTPQVPGHELAPFDFSALEFVDATPKSDRMAQVFREAVLARTQQMLCALDPLDVAVVVGQEGEYPKATHVLITGDVPLYGGDQIGQSDFDPCNEHADDAAVIWGGMLAGRINGAAFNQWVNAFANVTTHEIGHTLGFAHPSEETLARMLPVAAAEVMRARTSVADLLGEQAFLVSQQTCPGNSNASYSLVTD